MAPSLESKAEVEDQLLAGLKSENAELKRMLDLMQHQINDEMAMAVDQQQVDDLVAQIDSLTLQNAKLQRKLNKFEEEEKAAEKRARKRSRRLRKVFEELEQILEAEPEPTPMIKAEERK